MRSSDPDGTPPRFGYRRLIDLAVFLAAVGLFVWLLDRVGWKHIGAALGGVGFKGAAVILMLGFWENILDATALRFATGPGLPFMRLLATNSAGAALNMVLPWDLGEVVKATLIRKFPKGISGVVIWNYLFKLSRPLVSFVAALLGWTAATRMAPQVANAVVVANGLAFLPFFVIKLLLGRGIARVGRRVFALFPFMASHQARLLKKVESIDTEMRDFVKSRRRAYHGVVLAQVGARLASWMSLWAATQALGYGHSFWDVAAIYAALNVSEFILTLVPVKIGAQEGAGYVVFAALHLPPEQAVLLYVVTRLKVLVSNGLMGPFVLLWKDRVAAPTAP